MNKKGEEYRRAYQLHYQAVVDKIAEAHNQVPRIVPCPLAQIVAEWISEMTEHGASLYDLLSVLFGQASTPPPGKLAHTTAHALIEVGMTIQTMLTDGRLTVADLAALGVDPTTGEIDPEKEAAAVQELVGAPPEDAPSIEVIQEAGSLEELFRFLENADHESPDA